jgi:SAM-dependent methyltransferase
VADAMLAPGLAVMERARPQPGQRARRRLRRGRRACSWQSAAPDGSVLESTSRRPCSRASDARAEKVANLRFENADAQTFAFTPDGVDLIFSRFGVMFFADPKAAFTNLARALRPGGRLASCAGRRWRRTLDARARRRAGQTRDLPCRRRPTRPARSRSPTPRACAESSRAPASAA